KQRFEMESFQQLQQAIDDIRAGEGDAARAAEADLGFHSAVCEASGNSRLHDVFMRQATKLLTLLRLDEEKLGHQPDSIAGKHRHLFDALRWSDLGTAEAAFHEHLEDARDRMTTYVERTGSRR